jgi:dihydroorotase
VLHVSAAKTLDLVKEAKAQGLPVTCEVTPHHLFFTSSDIPEDQSSFKMNPPLRGESDKSRLIEELSTKLVDFVSTDHAPHEPARKGKDFRAAAFGTTGLETSLLVLLDLYNKGKLSSSRLVEVFSKKPAEFIGISNKFGSLSPQKLLNAVLVDVRAPDRKVDVSDLESLSKNNCFIGSKLPGKVLAHFNESGLFRF